ncbi:MAG: hypothetical protein LBC56_04065 [Oscillospiraceae bacterium]|jgi:hypothetical protein|nr:hypothetical protein [Oscillospiraceae bacterium]
MIRSSEPADVSEGVRKLIAKAGEFMQEKQGVVTDYGTPCHPSCIVYMGGGAEQHGVLQKDIGHVWGGNAEYIRFYQMELSGEDVSLRGADGAALSEEEIHAETDEMFSQTDIFSSMNRLNLFFILDTSYIENAESFEIWYKSVVAAKRLFATVSRTALILLLNESINQRSAAKSCRQFLKKYWEENNKHLYDSVFILSSRLSSGASFTPKPGEVCRDHNLLADIILLANTSGPELQPRVGTLYGGGVAFITAAYSSMQKPTEGIAKLILSRIFEYLEEEKEKLKNTSLGEEELLSALEVSPTKFGIFEDFYKSAIAPALPDGDCLNYLPVQSAAALSKIQGMSFDELNRETLGSWENFYHENFLQVSKEIFEGGDGQEAFKNRLKKQLFGKVKYPRLMDGIKDKICEDVFKNICRAYQQNSGSAKALRSAGIRLREKAVSALKPAYKSALEEARSGAQEYESCFESVYGEFAKVKSVGKAGVFQALEAYYSKIADNLFRAYIFENAGQENRFLYIKSGDFAQEILDYIFSLFKEIVEANRSILSQSLYNGLRAANINAGELIENELVSGIRDKIRFSSNFAFPDPAAQIYMFSSNAALVEWLNKSRGNIVASPDYFSSGRQDLIEMILIYRCDANLL